jgi:hypothetical protein
MVSFRPPSLESRITNYTVTVSPGNITIEGRRSPVRVPGLSFGVTYTFTVSANTNDGTGPQSLPSNSVTPAKPPGKPTDVVATAGANGEAIIAFTPPSDGGGPITSYTVKGPRGITAHGTTSPITVTGLTAGRSYIFRVQATNSIGAGMASRSNRVTLPR